MLKKMKIYQQRRGEQNITVVCPNYSINRSCYCKHTFYMRHIFTHSLQSWKIRIISYQRTENSLSNYKKKISGPYSPIDVSFVSLKVILKGLPFQTEDVIVIVIPSFFPFYVRIISQRWLYGFAWNFQGRCDVNIEVYIFIVNLKNLLVAVYRRFSFFKIDFACECSRKQLKIETSNFQKD